MNIDYNIPIEQQSTAVIRHLLLQSEQGESKDLPPLAKSMMLRGLNAELESRSTLHKGKESGLYSVRKYH